MTNWIKAQDIPKDWEATKKLMWRRGWGKHVDVDFIPPHFSRRNRHCDGVFYAELPTPPEDDTEFRANQVLF